MNARVIRLLLWIAVIGTLLASVTMAAAQDGPEEDGRINAAAEFQFAIYCVDADNNPASAYSEGGIRVLNPGGQEVLFVSNDTIVEIGETLIVNTLLGASDEVAGLELWRLTDNGFQLNGFDLHGKAFEFPFYSCAPILPPPEPPQEPDEKEDKDVKDECDIAGKLWAPGASPQPANRLIDLCDLGPCKVLIPQIAVDRKSIKMTKQIAVQVC